MIPGHEALILTAISTIAMLSILTFTMVARYRKSHSGEEALDAAAQG